MKSIQIKRKLKKKKKILSVIKKVSKMDETIIKISGNREDNYSKAIHSAFENSLACKTKLNEYVLSMHGLSGRKFRILLNSLIEKISNSKYLEIGSWLGSTACSVSFKNNVEINCIENWSQNFSKEFSPKQEFKKNLSKCLSKKVKLNLIEKEFRAVNYLKLKDINIYLYDGSHHYEDHFDSIKFALPALSKKFIFIVDDWNWIQVRQGTLDSSENENLKIIYKLDVRTTRDNSSALLTEQFSDWHQGFAIMVIEK